METEISRLFGKVRIEEPQITAEEISPSEGRIVIEPLMRGYGTTVGNALRRVMLSSLPGAAVTSVRIYAGGETVLHEISAVPGIKEDVCEIVLNVKGIVGKLYADHPVNVCIDGTHAGEITAGDIRCDADLIIVNPGQHIASVADGTDFRMELTFDNGAGYVSADRNKERYGAGEPGRIYVDSIYPPVLNVNYSVENTRVGGQMDYDRLTMTVTTNSSISPKEAVVTASQILKEHFNLLTGLCGQTEEPRMMEKSKQEQTQEILNRSIEEMEFSVRSFNCLKRAGIDTIGDLTDRTVDEMLKIRNLGKKSYEEIEERLRQLGVSFKKSDDC